VNVLSLFFTLIILENLVLTYGLGLDILYFREGKKWKFKTEFLRCFMLLAGGSLIFWVVYQLLAFMNLEFLVHIFLFLFITAILDLFRKIEVVRKNSPILGWLFESNYYQSPLFVGFIIISIIQTWSPFQIFIMSLGGALGIAVVTMLILHLKLSKKLEPIPDVLKGEPVFFFILGILSATFSLLDRVLFFIFIP
jgi:Na+-translocating ferredoxin:NAD+ oxidoreductase RnfA subunit